MPPVGWQHLTVNSIKPNRYQSSSLRPSECYLMEYLRIVLRKNIFSVCFLKVKCIIRVVFETNIGLLRSNFPFLFFSLSLVSDLWACCRDATLCVFIGQKQRFCSRHTFFSFRACEHLLRRLIATLWPQRYQQWGIQNRGGTIDRVQSAREKKI